MSSLVQREERETPSWPWKHISSRAEVMMESILVGCSLEVPKEETVLHDHERTTFYKRIGKT